MGILKIWQPVYDSPHLFYSCPDFLRNEWVTPNGGAKVGETLLLDRLNAKPKGVFSFSLTNRTPDCQFGLAGHGPFS